MLILHVLQGPDAGRRFPLPEREPQLIGRSTEAIDISDRSVSRRHAELTPDDGRWFVRDLESQNGTFVNGRPVLDPTPIGPGDRIRCGDTIFVVAIEVDLPGTPSSAPSRAPAASAIEATLPANAPAVADPRFRLLQELASLADRARRRGDILRGALELVREEFSAERSAFVVVVDGAPAIECTLGAAGAPAIAPEAFRQVVASGAGHLVLAAELDGPEAASALVVAVRTPERIEGALWVERPVALGAYDERHLRLLQAVGAHLGLLLRHAELVDATLARERLAAMGETVAHLSHSIKNILQALRGGADAVDLALQRGDLAMAREGWPILGRNLDRIYALTQNMLAYAKERALDLVPHNPNEIVQDVAALLAGAAQRRRVRIACELDDGMPPIVLDPYAVHQALMNLASNALDAAPERTGRVVLRTSFDAHAATASIDVVDDGPGIPDAIRDRLFEPFASSKGQRGTGLGLAVTRKIAEQHGGTAELVATGQHGTTMRLRLPAAGPDDDADRTSVPLSLNEEDLGIEFGDPE
jgi:signal transduction histidine kinase